MDTEATIFLYVCLGVSSIITRGEGAEYCQMETFNGSCSEGSVILMQRARYGRMRLGRCLTRDYFVGCEADVLPLLDQRCSGRRHCHMTVPDHSLLKSLSCPQDLVSHLEAEYLCIKGAWASASQCAVNRRIVLHPTGSGYLNSEVTQTTGIVGSDRCPWHLVVPPGQRLRITLIDLGISLNNASSKKSQVVDELGGGGTLVPGGSCILYATIREVQSAGVTEYVVCSSKSRENVVHTSRENRISIVVHATTTHRRESLWGQIRFFLKYEVIGCADPSLPSSEVHLVRRGEQVDVVCNDTHQSWHLVCRNTQWIGDYGNCTDGISVFNPVEPVEQSNWQYTYGLWFAVSAGVALGMAIGLGLLLVLYLHRQNKEEDSEVTQKAEIYSSGHFLPLDFPKNEYGGSPTQRACALYSCHEDGGTDHVHVRCLYDKADLLTLQP